MRGRERERRKEAMREGEMGKRIYRDMKKQSERLGNEVYREK